MLYDASKKSVGLAYFFAFFLGALGIHCFYVGKKWRGLIELTLAILGWLSLSHAMLSWQGEHFYYAGFFLLTLGIMWLYDLFTLHRSIEKKNLEIINKLSGDFRPLNSSMSNPS
jgi:TM2 domain-containing membrane protein YozV